MIMELRMPRTRKSAGDVKEPEIWAIKVRKLRIQNGLTQREIADHINVSQRVYADYELGRIRIPVDHLLKLSKFYDVSMDDLCSDEELSI
jgi:transcriptional regulator with XRE-family HTH domain